MSYWLVYTRCEECLQDSCLQCRRENRSLTLRVVEADDMPVNSLNGPCEMPHQILAIIGQYFGFDEDGKMYFRVDANE
jgi:hypothetical protein